MSLLSIEDLRISFPGHPKPSAPVRGLSLSLERGSVLGLVGQSGSGKSLSALAMMGMVPRPGRISGGRISLDGMELTRLSPSQYRHVRGRQMFLIFQGSSAALNPALTVGKQLAEVLVHLRGASWRAARAGAGGLLEQVRVDPRHLGSYPFELSGGMRQRVLVAMALAMEPQLIIADEPTTGLDVITQGEILALFADLRQRIPGGMILISHDLRVVASLADHIAVMHQGRVVDQAPTALLPARARHPHTRELLAAGHAFSLAEPC
ncbi:MAG: ABC transporter ATP-binding protein [Desulfarculaceae bacterium]|nr:ABC transporter ATP-binding protein [Desulfarculaceae bacterium]